ncbi:MAG: nicotinate-nucleotide adenylyltransferase [Methylococcaceae bacterium]|nr:nicotinate-nucleotide adenylyltransferase [Methylococcaceae bacterium]
MIGVMGGSFDPVHFGHLRTAVEIKESLNLDELRLVPCREPPHRPMPLAPAELRVNMLERAIGNEPGLLVDTRELDRPGPSYTYETLESLRDEFPEQALGLILGQDAFSGLQSWHRWQELPKLAHFIVLQRPGYRPGIPKALSQHARCRFPNRAEGFNGSKSGGVYFQKVSQLEISSSAIREIIGQDKNARFLLPEPVLELIRRQHLYR